MTLFILLIINFAFGKKYLPEIDADPIMDILVKVKTYLTLFVVLTIVIAFLSVFSSFICIFYGRYRDQIKYDEIKSEFLSREVMQSNTQATDIANQNILAAYLSQAQLNVSGGESSIETEIPGPEEILSGVNQQNLTDQPQTQLNFGNESSVGTENPGSEDQQNQKRMVIDSNGDEHPLRQSLQVSSQYNSAAKLPSLEDFPSLVKLGGVNSGKDDGIEIGDRVCDGKALIASPDDEAPIHSPLSEGKSDYDDVGPSEPLLQNQAGSDKSQGNGNGNDATSIKTPSPQTSASVQD